MKKLIIIIIGAFTLLLGVNVKGSTFYTLDTPILELNNHSLSEVYDNGNLYTHGNKTLNEYAYNSRQRVTLIENHYYYVNRITKPISPYTAEIDRFGRITVLQPELFDLLNTNRVIGYSSGIRQFPYSTQENISLYFYGISGYDGIDTAIFKNVHLIDITSLGIDNLTVEQMDYWYSVYQDLLKDIDRVSQLPNLFIDLFNELTDNFVIGIKGFTQLIYLDGYGLTDLGIISLIVIAISVIGISVYIIRKVIK